jgi:hypothetical protein
MSLYGRGFFLIDRDGMDRRNGCADGCRNRRADDCSNFGTAQRLRRRPPRVYIQSPIIVFGRCVKMGHWAYGNSLYIWTLYFAGSTVAHELCMTPCITVPKNECHADTSTQRV